MKVLVHTESGNVQRSRLVASAMVEGLRRHREEVHIAGQWCGQIDADVLLAYGWHNKPAFDAYRKAGNPYVHVDMGYWNRKPTSNRLNGHYKVTVNSRHPTKYFRIGLPDDRLKRHIKKVDPWRKAGKHILVAGTSARVVIAEGGKPQKWERRAIKAMREHTQRPIIYRPKPTPTWRNAPAIPGVGFSPPTDALERALDSAWCVVTRHSNVAIDGLLKGIPCYSEEGVASLMSMQSLADVEHPYYPEDRWEFLADLAYTQWTPAEMRSGECWAHIKEHVLPCA